MQNSITLSLLFGVKAELLVADPQEADLKECGELKICGASYCYDYVSNNYCKIPDSDAPKKAKAVVNVAKESEKISAKKKEEDYLKPFQ